MVFKLYNQYLQTMQVLVMLTPAYTCLCTFSLSFVYLPWFIVVHRDYNHCIVSTFVILF